MTDIDRSPPDAEGELNSGSRWHRWDPHIHAPKRFAKWLYSTDHISLHYSIDYDGSTFNISLLVRGASCSCCCTWRSIGPTVALVIDQPEENLDPKSIYDELVQLFVDAKLQRQVIIITHNANLVINTDADQIIVAEAPIRKAVCDILEGGQVAFKERARRLRVRLDR